MTERRRERVQRAITKRAVHYSDHGCRLLDPSAPNPGIIGVPVGDGRDRWSWFGTCPVSSAAGRAVAVTTDRSRVTCRPCLAELARRDGWDAARPAHALPVSDALRQLDAWEQCCAARGAPAPRLSEQAREADRAHRLRRDLDSAAVAARVYVAARATGTGPDFEAWLEGMIERFSPEVIDRVHPVLHGAEIAAQAAEAAAVALVEGIEALELYEAAS